MRETDPTEASTQIDEFRSTDEQYARKPDPRVGLILDSKYKLLESLGQGGMGSIFRAQRLHIGDEVAVKLLHHDLVREEKALERFRREARAAAMIRHPNVVSIHDFNDGRSEATQPYIVMELVRGVSLGDLLRREGRMRPERAVRLMHEVCTGVGVAHRQRLLHRDLKPDNVIVVPPSHEGDEETAKVVDFGLAKVRDVGASTALTHTGAVIGTLYYMSPEQCSGEELDARADVYSLGAMFYEMLSGGPPFRSRNLAGLIAKHLNEPPPPFPEELRVPKALEAVCFRALAKDPNERQPDAIVLGRELQNALIAPAVAYQPASGATPSRRSPLKWLIAAVGLFVALLVIIAAGFAIKFGRDQFRSPPSASPPSTVAPVIRPPQSRDPVLPTDVDLRGTWTGTYGHMGVGATLIIKNHKGDKLDGVLEQAAVRVAFTGTYDPGSKSLKLTQTKVLSGEGWSLGEDTGKLSDDGRMMSGTGKDAMGGPLGFQYQWSFTRNNAEGVR